MKSKGYLLFSFIVGFIVVAVAGIVIFIAASSVITPPSDFPVYAYRDYIDRSESMIFTADGGAQLYEAEKAELSNGASVQNNAIASGDKNVGMKENSIIKYGVSFDKDCTIQLKLSVCYVSETERDTDAQNLFSVCLDGAELATRRVNIFHCYNTYDFKENLLYTVDIAAGEHTVEFISAAEGYTIDYMVLISKAERTAQEETLGFPVYAFKTENDAQRYEAEQAERVSAVPVYDGVSSSGYYTRSVEKDGALTFYPESDKQNQTILGLALKNYGESENISNFCEIYVNGVKLSVSASVPKASEEQPFSVTPIGAIDVKQGLNEIKIVNIGGNYHLDYIALNTDINYSVEKNTMRYEAEKATLAGGCRVEPNSGVSEGYNVGYNDVASSITFIVRSAAVDEAYLSLRISYWGEETALANVLTIIVNGQALDLSNQPIWHTGGYEYYVDVFLGSISIQQGDNTVIIESLNANYNVDYMALSSVIFSVDDSERKYEGEHAVLSGGCQTEWNDTASGGQNVGFNVVGSSVNFAIVSNGEATVRLVLSLSFYRAEDGLMSDYLTVTVNGQNLNIYDIVIKGTDDWAVFAENYAGDIRLNEGLNTITVTSKSETYNLDYIALTTLNPSE